MDKTEYIAQGTRDGLFKKNAKLRRYYNYNSCVTHSFPWIRYRFGNLLLTSQLLKDSIWMYECMKNLVLYNLFCFLKNISHLKCIVHTLYVMPASLFSVHRRYTCSNRSYCMRYTQLFLKEFLRNRFQYFNWKINSSFIVNIWIDPVQREQYVAVINWTCGINYLSRSWMPSR